MTTGPPAYRLRGTPAVLWRPVVLYAALGAAMGGAVVGTSPSLYSSFLDGVGGFLAMWIFIAGVLWFITIPWWLWRAGRTSYEVEAGVLRMLAGQTLVQEWPLSGISVVRLDSGASWVDLLTPFNIDGGVFPRLCFLADGPVSGRPLLIWGHQATRAAESDLLAAIARNR